MNSIPPIQMMMIEEIVVRALEEDIYGGDITSYACLDADSTCTAKAVARQSIVACGSNVAACVFAKVDPTLIFKTLAMDGNRIEAGDPLWQVSGSARSILMGERVALNFVQRLSGIATLTRKYVEAIPKGCATRITDTRKTTPGLRVLERYAVRVGGGYNHRDNLSSAVLIKDNHIAASGGIVKAIERSKAFAPHTCRIECEVETLDQLQEALSAGVDIVLLDNMDTAMVEKAVRMAEGKAIIEASGGVTLARVPELALAGVDVISVGALTHSAPAADIGLDM